MARTTLDLGREPHWRLVISRWRRSGLSVREFCRSEGVSEPSFYVWRRKLEAPKAETSRGSDGPAFLPVQVVADTLAPAPTAGIEVVLTNGRCVRVAPGFDSRTLVRLVALLEADEEVSC